MLRKKWALQRWVLPTSMSPRQYWAAASSPTGQWPNDMPIVLWFSRLQPGVSPEDYEDFVRSVDYPATKRIPSIARYQSIRLYGPALGEQDLDYDFIDLAEITDIEGYRQDLKQHPAVEEVHRQFEKYVESIGNFWAVQVGEGAIREDREVG